MSGTLLAAVPGGESNFRIDTKSLTLGIIIHLIIIPNNDIRAGDIAMHMNNRTG